MTDSQFVILLVSILIVWLVCYLLWVLYGESWYNEKYEPKKKKSQTSVIKETIVERYNEVVEQKRQAELAQVDMMKYINKIQENAENGISRTELDLSRDLNANQISYVCSELTKLGFVLKEEGAIRKTMWVYLENVD